MQIDYLDETHFVPSSQDSRVCEEHSHTKLLPKTIHIATIRILIEIEIASKCRIRFFG